MSKWKVLIVLALLAFALGLEYLGPRSGEVVRLTALGVLLATFVVCYLWWRVLAAATRLVLLLLLTMGTAFLLHRWGLWNV